MSVVDIRKYSITCTSANQQLIGNMSQFHILSKDYAVKQIYLYISFAAEVNSEDYALSVKCKQATLLYQSIHKLLP